MLPTATDVFSLKGTGDASVIVIANETDGTFKNEEDFYKYIQKKN